MMNPVDYIVGFFSANQALSRAVDRSAYASFRRMEKASMSYNATGNGRRGYKSTGDGSAKAIGMQNLVTARKNTRDMYRNNSIYKAAVNAKTRHTIGNGIRPSIVDTKPNKSQARKRKIEQVQKLVSTWANSIHSDVYGVHNLFGQQFLGYKTMCNAGEYLILRQRTLEKKSGLHLQLKMLEGDYLDHLKTTTNPDTGNAIINGVEFNDTDGEVAYWLFDQHPGDIGMFKRFTLKSRRHDAENVIHMFDCERPGMIRGLPKGLASFTKIKNLEEFQDARLEQMKVAACLVGVVKTTSRKLNNGETASPLPAQMQPGAIMEMDANQDITFNQPPSVSGQHDFVTEELHQIASDFEITYPALTGDYSKVNFSSGRLGRLDMYSAIENDRARIVIPRMLDKIWGWLQDAMDLQGVPVRDFDCSWIPPSREMFDPTKEIPPLLKAVRGGLKPMQEALLEMGKNPDTVLDQYRDWNEKLDDRNLIFDTDPRHVSGAGNPNQVPEEKDDDKQTNPGNGDS